MMTLVDTTCNTCEYRDYPEGWCIENCHIVKPPSAKQIIEMQRERIPLRLIRWDCKYFGGMTNRDEVICKYDDAKNIYACDECRVFSIKYCGE